MSASALMHTKLTLQNGQRATRVLLQKQFGLATTAGSARTWPSSQVSLSVEVAPLLQELW
jgi:hypothetical protein